MKMVLFSLKFFLQKIQVFLEGKKNQKLNIFQVFLVLNILGVGGIFFILYFCGFLFRVFWSKIGKCRAHDVFQNIFHFLKKATF